MGIFHTKLRPRRRKVSVAIYTTKGKLNVSLNYIQRDPLFTDVFIRAVGGLSEKEMTVQVPKRRKYLRMRQQLTEGWR